jgi:hypothetical protein
MSFKDQIYAVSAVSDVDWYRQQLAGSGISPDLADYNGIVLHPGHYEMPYFDADGELTRVSTRRNNTDDKDKRYSRKAGKGLSIPPTCYWPRHPALQSTHSELLLRDIRWPLFVCEGEKKALALQDALVRTGVPGSVVSVPGVTNYAAAIKETKHIFMAGGDLRRMVWIVYDWHHANTMVMGAEANVHDEFDRRGADVHHLRWPVTPSDGEQKIDDYLVNGGSLVDAIKHSIATPPQLPRDDYRWLNDHYAVYNGRVVKLADGTSMSKAEFVVDTSHMQEPGKRSEMVPTAEGWLKWKYRGVIDGRCVVMPTYGNVADRLVDNKINLAKPWPTCLLTPAPDDFDPAPWHDVFDTHLRRFSDADEHWTWLRQHIAHMIRYPNTTTSNAVALADDGGTGKGLLMGILQSALGQLFVLVASELVTQFNINLAGRLLAHYDEPPSDKWEGGTLDKAAKRIVGNKELTVVAKGRDGFTVENRLRLFVTTNLAAVYGIPESDRRWNYFCGYEPLSGHDAEELAKLRDHPLCPHIITSWAENIPLEGYDPMRRGPTSKARRKAIAASRGPVEFWLEESDELANGPDIWTGQRLFELFRLTSGGRGVAANTFGAELNRILGEDSARTIRIDKKQLRVRAIRDVSGWKKRENMEWAAACDAVTD